MANLLKNNQTSTPKKQPIRNIGRNNERNDGRSAFDNATKTSASARKTNIIRWFDIENYMTKDFVLTNLPFLFFLTFLLLIYIYSNRQIEGKARQINKLTTEIKEMRWEYISLKTQLMGNSKQSAIARKVQPYGLEELTQAPQKIYVEE